MVFAVGLIRPTAWVLAASSGAAAGRRCALLVEIPSREEIHDNVVAFFTPDEKAKPGVPMRFACRMLWGWPSSRWTSLRFATFTTRRAAFWQGHPRAR
jgi:glucan biosynthesis protein